jgi:hypothetical protein
MDQKRGPNAVLIVILLLWAMVSLYVLSIGPVARLANAGVIQYTRTDAANGFYAPLFWLCDNCKLVERALRVYLGLWGV